MRHQRLEAESNAVLLGIELGPDDLVFAYPDGRPLDPSTVPHVFGKVLKEAGLPHLRFHDLRHTFATYMACSPESSPPGVRVLWDNQTQRRRVIP